MAGVPSVPMDLCEGLCPAVVGGEVTEGQPGWEGTGSQSRWEGDMGVLCTRWRIQETTKEPTLMQTTRVVIQTRAWVQVYPTEWSRELDPEDGFSLVLRAGLGDLQKGWSNSSSSVHILIWGLQGH